MTASDDAILAFIAKVRPREGRFAAAELPGADPARARRVLVLEHVEKIEVELYEEDGSLATWRRPERTAAAAKADLPLAEAVAIAATDADLPAGAATEFVRPDDGSPLIFVAWRHLHHGVWVEPDFVMASVDPSARVVCSLSRRWSVVPPEAGIPDAESTT